MATYVLVHGAWAGGWCWSRAARRLRTAGHDVFTPTLTSQGERAHLFSPEVGLDTHVRDVVGVLEYEDLGEVILVGHSYGGTVITGVAEEASSRLALLVYLDAFVPTDGQSTFDFFPVEFREAFRARAQEGDGWRIPGGEDILDLWAISDPGDREWVRAKLTPFPVRCFEQPAKLPADAAPKLARTYVACTTGPLAELFGQFAEQARREGWDHHEVATGHAAWVTAPDEIAEILLGIAGPASRSSGATPDPAHGPRASGER